MKTTGHGKKPIILVLLLIGAAVLTFYYYDGVGKADELVFTGSVEADQIDVSPEISGTIQTISVMDGEAVKKGQILLTMDTSDFAIKLEMARKGLELAKLKESDIKDGNSANQVRQARANRDSISEQISGSAKELEYLKKDYTTMKALLDAGAASQSELDTARRVLDREQARYDGLIKQKDALSATLALAEEGATAQTKSGATLEVEMKQLEIQDMERVITKGTLYSPVDGTIQSVNYQEGERIAPGNRTVTVVDLGRMTVRIYVPEKQLNRVSTGMEVEFTDDFLKDKEIQGTITYISPKAEFTPKNIESKQSKQEMVYEVWVDIKDTTNTVKPGMFLDVTLKEGKS